MNKSTGQMYPWVDFTWNPVKGCKHNCSYCYVKTLAKRYGYSMEPRLDEKELKADLSNKGTIFVCSTSDLFGDFVPDEWIKKVLQKCNEHPENTYLMQSKNPKRIHCFTGRLPPKVIIGTTIETDKTPYYVVYNGKTVARDKFSDAPSPPFRAMAMAALKGFDKMVSVEPVIDFTVADMVDMIRSIHPKFVSIGADSKHNNLPEPHPEKLRELITELEKFTEVRLKDNIKRLMNDEN